MKSSPYHWYLVIHGIVKEYENTIKNVTDSDIHNLPTFSYKERQLVLALISVLSGECYQQHNDKCNSYITSILSEEY